SGARSSPGRTSPSRTALMSARASSKVGTTPRLGGGAVVALLPPVGSESDRRSKSASCAAMRRWGVLLAMFAALGAVAPARAAAPKGPPLDVPRATLAASLSCTANLASAKREPVLLVPGTTQTPEVNFSWNYEPALTARGVPWCAVTLPAHGMGDIQVAAEYVVSALRTMHARTKRK